MESLQPERPSEPSSRLPPRKGPGQSPVVSSRTSALNAVYFSRERALELLKGTKGDGLKRGFISDLGAPGATVLATSLGLGLAGTKVAGEMAAQHGSEDPRPVQTALAIGCSALIGCAFVVGKYITPSYFGKLRAPDAFTAVGETLLGAVTGLTLGMSTSMVASSVMGEGSMTTGIIGGATGLTSIYIGYRLFLYGPIGKAIATVGRVGGKFLRLFGMGRKQKVVNDPALLRSTYEKIIVPNGPTIEIVHGNLFNEKTEVWLNPWNTNRFTGLLRPLHTKMGVSGKLAEFTGREVFTELASFRRIPKGEARLTGAGARSFHLKGIIHTATMLYPWGTSKELICSGVRNALEVCRERSFKSIAMPLIGAGHGKITAADSLEAVVEAATKSKFKGLVRIVIMNKDKFSGHTKSDPYPKWNFIRRLYRRFP